MRIYVAGSSDELDRVAAFMGKARALRFEVTFDWVAEIRAVGAANPPDVTRKRRRQWAEADLLGVRQADVFVMLAPEIGHARGAFYELCHAVDRRITSIVAGPTHACSIFSALASYEVPTESAVLDLLLELRTATGEV